MKLSTSFLLLLLVVSLARAQESTILWMHGGHSDQATATLFSPDSRRLVSAGLDGLVKVWDPVSGRLLRTLGTGSGSVLSLSFSNDGGMLAAGNVDGTVELWDMSSYRVIRTYRSGSPVNGVAISPDELTIASAHASGELTLWDLDAATVRRQLVGHSYAVNVVAFSPDSRLVASGSDDFALILWNAETGAETKRSVQPQFPTTALAFSPDGQRIALSGGGHMVVELSVPELVASQTANQHTVTIRSVAYSPNGRLIASVSEDFDVPGFILENTVIVSDRQRRKGIFEFKQEFAGGQGTSVAFSPDGRWMVWGSSSGMIRLRELAPEDDTAIFRGAMRTITDHYRPVRAAAFSPVEGILASAAEDGAINLWQAGSGTLIRRLRGHENGVNALDFTRDGRSLASAGVDGSVQIWNVATGALQSTVYISAQSPATSVAFSPDGRRIAAGSGFGDTTVGIWDTNRIDPVRTFRGHTSHITAVAYGGDGQQVVSASDDGTVRVWNSATGALEFTLAQSTLPYTALSLSGNGQVLAAANADGSVRIWAMPAGDPLTDIDAHDARINGIDLTHDGSFLVTASRDRTIRVWDVADRSELHRYEEYPFEHLSVAVLADSGWIASGTSDASIVVQRLVTVSSVEENGESVRIAHRASPNPFVDRLAFELSTARAGDLAGAIFDARGARVATIEGGRREPGRHRIELNMPAISDGLYFYRIMTADGIATGTIVRRSGR